MTVLTPPPPPSPPPPPPPPPLLPPLLCSYDRALLPESYYKQADYIWMNKGSETSELDITLWQNQLVKHVDFTKAIYHIAHVSCSASLCCYSLTMTVMVMNTLTLTPPPASSNSYHLPSPPATFTVHLF